MLNCTQYPALQPDSDISGIGVLSAFMGTAYLTLICCVAKAIIDHKKTAGNGTRTRLDRWAFAFGEVIVILSDQQVITGISILLGGFSQLHLGLSIYQWESVVNLAWFSTVTHLLTLTVLREKASSNTPIRIFRIIGMAVLILMYIPAAMPVGYMMGGANSVIPLNFPAWCLYRPNLEWGSNGAIMYRDKTSFNGIYVAINIIVLVYTFISRLLLLLSGQFSVSHTLLRIPQGQPWRSFESAMTKLKCVTSCNFWLRAAKMVTYKQIYSCYAFLAAGRDMYKSKLWEITWLSACVAWGTIRIFDTRFGSQYPGLNNELSQQNVWSFGQVVALGLLVLPLISFFEAFFSPHRSDIMLPSSVPHTPTLSFERTFPPPTGIFAARGLNTSPTRSDYHIPNSWYSKLLWLWYLFSLKAVIFCLLAFGFGGGPHSIVDDNPITDDMKTVMVPIAVDGVILWLCTQILAGCHIQKARKFGKILSATPVRVVGWILSIGVPLTVSLLFELIFTFGFASLMPPANVFRWWAFFP